MTAYRVRAVQEWSRFTLGVRRAAGCAAFASVWVGAWVGGVWLVGDRYVYADGPVEGRQAPASGAMAFRARSPALEPVAGHDPLPEDTELSPLTPLHPRDYPLDGLSRAVIPGVCPDVALTTFAGESIQFSPEARVALPFRARLLELEHVVRDLALVFYGRPPSAILVASSYDCRSVSGKNRRLSEHALGNAIDIAGFRFAASGGSGALAPAFEVRIAQHWKAAGDAELERHARFLEALTQALLARDVFRTLLGPAHPDHADHFHFDMARQYYVDL
jgi:hypothetical protein